MLVENSHFKIEIPYNWEIKYGHGTDSFVGGIYGPRISLAFDSSDLGFSNSLIPSLYEYVYQGYWERGIPYGEKGVIYTSKSNISDVKAEEMKKRGIIDSTLVRVEELQRPVQTILKENRNYSALLTYKDTSIIVPIEIPFEIRIHDVKVDTINNCYRKIVRPKLGRFGMTGIYLRDLESGYTLNFYDYYISTENQERLMEVFETIEIVRLSDN